jgi:uncharacterized protein YidB (DUF937 family)
VHAAVIEKLLLYPQDCILRSLSDAEFYDGFGWNLDLLLRCGINSVAGFPFLLHQLAKTGQDEFAVLFGGFAGDGAERIEEYAGGLFIGLRRFGKCALKFCLGHLEEGLRGGGGSCVAIVITWFGRGMNESYSPAQAKSLSFDDLAWQKTSDRKKSVLTKRRKFVTRVSTA